MCRGNLANGLSSMPSATGGIARLACDRLRDAGIDPAPAMLGAGLTTEDVQDSKRRLDASAQVRVLELAAKELQDDCFGFHLARGFELGRDRATVLRYGLVGAARRRASKRGAL